MISHVKLQPQLQGSNSMLQQTVGGGSDLNSNQLYQARSGLDGGTQEDNLRNMLNNY